MGHAHYSTRKQEQAADYRAHLKQQLKSFLDRTRVEPRSHGRILKAGE